MFREGARGKMLDQMMELEEEGGSMIWFSGLNVGLTALNVGLEMCRQERLFTGGMGIANQFVR